MVFLRDRRIRLELATGGKGGGVQTIWAGVRWIKVTTYFAYSSRSAAFTGLPTGK